MISEPPSQDMSDSSTGSMMSESEADRIENASNILHTEVQQDDVETKPFHNEVSYDEDDEKQSEFVERDELHEEEI